MDDINIIDSIESYIKYLSFLKANYALAPIASSPVGTGFLFRGITNHNYSLIPSAYRLHCCKYGETTIENSLYLSFVDEKSIIKEFRNEARHFLTGTNIDNFIHWAEYAQHYGVPTRFLDWTSNPLVALFFACNGSETEDGVVWCLHQNNYLRLTHNPENNEAWASLNGTTIYDLYEDMLRGKKNLPYPIIYVPNYIDSRMSAQSSYFLLWGNDKRPLDKIVGKEYYIDYKENKDGIVSYGSDQEKKILMKLIIKSPMKQTLLRSLDMLGISKKTLFPGLDGLGDYIKWKYQFNEHDDMI